MSKWGRLYLWRDWGHMGTLHAFPYFAVNLKHSLSLKFHALIHTLYVLFYSIFGFNKSGSPPTDFLFYHPQMEVIKKKWSSALGRVQLVLGTQAPCFKVRPFAVIGTQGPGIVPGGRVSMLCAFSSPLLWWRSFFLIGSISFQSSWGNKYTKWACWFRAQYQSSVPYILCFYASSGDIWQAGKAHPNGPSAESLGDQNAWGWPFYHGRISVEPPMLWG